MGVSGRLMLDAVLGGNAEPAVLAELARGRLRKKLPDLRKALEGRFRPHHRFMLEQVLGHLDFLDEWISRVSEEVAHRMDPFCRQIDLLRTIPGVDRKTAEVILSEIGPDMGHFPSDRHLASWAGLCPGNNESAGKRKSGKTRKGNQWGCAERSWKLPGPHLTRRTPTLVPNTAVLSSVVEKRKPLSLLLIAP